MGENKSLIKLTKSELLCVCERERDTALSVCLNTKQSIFFVVIKNLFFNFSVK